MRSHVILAILTLEFGASCSGGESRDAGSSDDVTGHRHRFYRTEDRDIAVADDLADTSVLVPYDGGFATLPVVTTGDGGFRVPNVPLGSVFYFRIGTQFLVTTARRLNLDDHYLQGRPGVASAVGKRFEVTLNLQNVSAQEFLSIEMVDVNSGAWGGLDPESRADAGSLLGPAGAAVNVGGIPDGTAGTTTWLNSFETTGDGGGIVTYRNLERSLKIDGLLISADGGSSLSGSFVAAPSQPAALDVRFEEFAAHAMAVSPGSRATLGTVNIVATPGAAGLPMLRAGYFGALATYSDFFFSHMFQATNLVATLQYGNPYPATWPVYVGVFSTFRTPSGRSGSLQDRRPISAAAGTAIQPRVSPPKALTVDGKSAYLKQILDNVAPTLAWSPPDLGTAVGYRVTVFDAFAPTGSETVCTVFTTRTELVMPPGIFQTGFVYVVRVTAVVGPEVNFDTDPFAAQATLDQGSADTMSHLLTAP